MNHGTYRTGSASHRNNGAIAHRVAGSGPAKGEGRRLTRLKVRVRLEMAVALCAGVLGLLTIFWHDWIEMLTGLDPDQHNGSVEWLLVAVVTNPPAQTAGVPTGPVAAAPPAPGEAGLTVAAWQWIGPGNIGGRVRGIVIDPGNASRMWAASVGGGVWHTQDGGATWAAV